MSPAAVSMLQCAEDTCRAGGESILHEEDSSMCATKPKKIILDKKESEKQILVDPISLRESANIQPMMYPVTTGPKMVVMSVPLHHLLPPAAKTSKLMSCSLPNSASSSPCFDLTFAKHKRKYKNHPRPLSPLARQHSVALGNLERLRESHLRRSKSCGEGRACQPSVDFDMWSSTNNKIRDNETEAREEKREEGRITSYKKGGDEGDSYEDKFKCGACLFLPGLGLGLGLGKGKTVRARKEVEAPHVVDIVSQRVSLEKFECGSWRSSAVVSYEEDGDTTSNLFFDLPVELIRCSSVNDTESPVTTGFVFDNKDHHRKGVLKSTSTSGAGGQPRKSQESCNSSRHVRFSTSSPTLCPASPSSTCITPRLRKARDDFNAFLEAQSA